MLTPYHLNTLQEKCVLGQKLVNIETTGPVILSSSVYIASNPAKTVLLRSYAHVQAGVVILN